MISWSVERRAKGPILAALAPVQEKSLHALLVNPRFPDTFWSLNRTAGFMSAKAAMPSLGLLTVAAMLPQDWSLRYVDLNAEPLTGDHLHWAGLVFIGAMEVQSESVGEIIRRCAEKGVRVAAGGPYFSVLDKRFQGVDHLFVGEVEETLPLFLEDLGKGRAAPVYRARRFPALSQTPIPRWDLVTRKNFLSMCLQMGRGCPNDCDFCHVVILNGRKPRLKTAARVVAELESLYASGWKRGEVMFVDDNLIGRKERIKEILRAVIAWQEKRKYPFHFSGQVGMDIADDKELLELMAKAGFSTVFLGIESPSDASLEECHKFKNRNRDLVASVRRIMDRGILVVGGFILGFDADTPEVFREMAELIEACPIPHPMIGLLNIPPQTRLWERMEKQGRLLGLPSGDNVGDPAGVNFVPKMGLNSLISGYLHILKRMYGTKRYYSRLLRFIRVLPPHPHLPGRLRVAEINAFFRILWRMGVVDRERFLFWKFTISALFANPRVFPLAMTLAACGRHYRLFHQGIIERLETEFADSET